jgi:hypothetical protein
VTIWPAIVKVPLRAPPVFAEAVNPTAPSPLPLAPDVTVSQRALLTAVQVHPSAASTAIGVPAPPAANTDVFNGVTTYEHDSEAWLTEMV